MRSIASLFLALVIAMPSAAASKVEAELPKPCGKFPHLMPYGIYLGMNDEGRVLWNQIPVDLIDLGPKLKAAVATNEQKTNVIIVFEHTDRDVSHKKFLEKLLAHYGLAFSRTECSPTLY